MHAVKVLHTGDMHLGTVFSSLDYSSSRLRADELEGTVLGLISKASEYNIVLFAGDVFDSDETSKITADKLLDAVQSFPDTHFFWACGNHDPYFSSVVRYCLRRKPENLHIFSPDELEYVTVEELRVRIYGRSFAGRHVASSMLKSAQLGLDDGYINILCMHAEPLDSGEGRYNPVSLHDISASGFDYIALGHVHTHSGVKKAGTVSYAYCGCPEGRGYDECGDKGYLSLQISKTGITHKFVSCCRRRYVDERIDITELRALHEIVSLADDIVGSGNIGRIELVGENNISSFINTDHVERSCAAFSLECTDSTHTPLKFSDAQNDITLKGICASKAAKMLEVAQSDDEKDLIKRAYTLLLEEFDGRG